MGNSAPVRSFQTVHAEPGQRPLWIGLFGPSGGGKTFTALRLATGIQAVIGGRINFIDTESGRGLHYADKFDYDYTAFPAPHGSLDYLQAIRHAEKQGATVTVIDSMSHQHDGEGGLIEAHDAEVERMVSQWKTTRDAVNMLAWNKPKAEQKQLLRAMIAYGTRMVFILCFRADEQSKPIKEDNKTKVIQMGFMPIAGRPFVYEATVCALLMPGANGVPTWEPENVGEKMMRKLPSQFKDLFEKSKGQPLSEAHGRELAEWSLGGKKLLTGKQGAPKTLEERVSVAVESIRSKDTRKAVENAWNACSGLLGELEDAGKGLLLDQLTSAKDKRLEELAK